MSSNGVKKVVTFDVPISTSQPQCLTERDMTGESRVAGDHRGVPEKQMNKDVPEISERNDRKRKRIDLKNAKDDTHLDSSRGAGSKASGLQGNDEDIPLLLRRLLLQIKKEHAATRKENAIFQQTLLQRVESLREFVNQKSNGCMCHLGQEISDSRKDATSKEGEKTRLTNSV
ncbi:hypothetical protein GALMADRAFT_217738, partial [Galerina marginata CBS 339.88]